MTHEVVDVGRPRFEHDHDDCVFLGPAWGGSAGYADLYFCEQGGALPTVIARFSDDGPDYTSGMALADADPWLMEAKRRADDLGLTAELIDELDADVAGEGAS